MPGTYTVTTQDKIRKTAIRLFLENGFERTSIRDIAKKAKINIALLNYYFRSKENLFESIFTTLVGKYSPLLNGILNSEKPLDEKVNEYVSNYIDILIENPRLTYFVLSVMHRNPDKIKKFHVFQSLYNTEVLSKQLAAEAKLGNIRPTDTTQFFISMLSMITFPFAVKNLLIEQNNMDEAGFIEFMQERKGHISGMLLLSIKK
jgi:TetR/AcrR family transcriptional regulator